MGEHKPCRKKCEERRMTINPMLALTWVQFKRERIRCIAVLNDLYLKKKKEGKSNLISDSIKRPDLFQKSYDTI